MKGALMIITFIGHSSLNIDTELSNKIKETIQNNIKKDIPVHFYCGGYGDFDQHCVSVCQQLKDQNLKCEIVFITPYITPCQQKKLNNLLETNRYDSIIYPPIESVPPRFAIPKRNEWMIEKSDLIIAYVSQKFGGAYKSLEYARRKKKK